MVAAPLLGASLCQARAAHCAGSLSILRGLGEVGLPELRFTAVGAAGPDHTAGQEAVEQRGCVRQEGRAVPVVLALPLVGSSEPHGFSGHHEEWWWWRLLPFVPLFF